MQHLLAELGVILDCGNATLLNGLVSVVVIGRATTKINIEHRAGSRGLIGGHTCLAAGDHGTGSPVLLFKRGQRLDRGCVFRLRRQAFNGNGPPAFLGRHGSSSPDPRLGIVIIVEHGFGYRLAAVLRRHRDAI